MNSKRMMAVALAAAMTLCGGTTSQAKKVHTIGDSTMANYDEEATVTRGWCMYLQQFLQNITVNNRGKGGASSKSFYREAAYWASVKTQMEPGDYVIIQFAHNDEKTSGADGDSLIAYYNATGNSELAATTDYRGTTPYDTYKQYLRLYIEETRAMGCTPILATPICRMYFSGNTIRRNGRHDLGDSFTKVDQSGVTTKNSLPESDHTMDYAWQMKQVAEEMDVPLIDLTTATEELFLSYGDEKCHALLSDGDGSTHLSTMGATLIARLCAQEMERQGLLSEHIVLPTDLSVSPGEADMGEAYRGQTVTKEFSLSGFGLTPATGTVSIAASDGLKLSTDKQQWSQTISIDYNESTLIASFYAALTFDEAGPISKQITITSGEKSITIPVTASCVALEGGTAVTAYWRLESNSDYTLTGPATVIGQSWSKMYVQRYSSPNAEKATWPEWTGFDASRKTQRNLIEGDTWPDGEIDEVSDRYIEFAVTAAQGTTLKIDSIGLFVCGCGGNGMMCHINYSTEPAFANQHTIFAPTKMAANNMMEVSATPVISLNDTDTLRLRVYPWYNGSATGKTICLSDVTIRGRAFDNNETTSIGKAATAQPTIVATTRYDAAGRKVTNARRGLAIERRTMSDGTTRTVKLSR